MRRNLLPIYPLLALGLLLDFRAAGATNAALPASVAIEDFSYLDTSGEPIDQTAAHERRLQGFMAALRRDVEAEARYQLVPSAQAEATFRIVGGVQKTSTLVQWAKVAVIDVAANTVLMEKLYTFRGDNDQAWERAEAFVSRDIRATLVAAAQPAPIALAVFDFELEDTTAASAAGLAPPDAAHLAEVTHSVREALEQSGRYRLIDVSGADADAVKTRALRDCGGCDAAIAKSSARINR